MIRDRDQSYFLFATTREQLDVLRFPLGGLPKARVRELAREFGLAIADKQDSQDICFVPTGRYADVIERLRPGAAAPGDIVDLSGKVLGRHDGIIHFTVGQRKGLKIAAREPLYVVRLEAGTRRVVVGPRAALATRTIRLHDVNWIGDGAIEDAPRREVFVKVRSTRAPRPAWLSRGRDGVEVELVDGEEGVAPGQACVFYDAAEGEARVLGGGFIRSARSGGAAAPRGEASRRTPDVRDEGRWRTRSIGRGREGLCALGAGLRSRVRQGVRARAQGLDRGGRARRRAHPRSRRRHRHLAARLCAHQRHRRHRHLGADAAQGAGARRRARPAPMSRRSP